MTVIDFIDVIDDIIDLSSDEETVQQENIATQPRATLLDRPAVFVLADEGRQDAQAAFFSDGEASQEATESENALVATAESENCASFPTATPLPSPTSTTPKVLTSEMGDTQLVTTALPWVMEKAPFGTAESNNSPTSPASAPLPSPTSATPKALTSEVGDTKLVRVKHPKKNYHTTTPRRSPRLLECCNNSVEDLAADHKRSRMGIVVALPAMQNLQTPSLLRECCNIPVEELAADHKRSRIGIVVALPAMQNLQTPSLLRECCNNSVEELAADHKRSRIGIVVALPAMQNLQTPSLLNPQTKFTICTLPITWLSPEAYDVTAG